ncbi:MAG TPA: IS110 family transposase [Vicinamibacteria bacterium]|nr:IS110 family transposase [Vicinamibacteria bacterium]
MRYFCGLDWAKDEHAVCVLDETGTIRARIATPHTADGLRELIVTLRKITEPATLPIAIERPSGLLVDVLVEAGFPVIPIHPNALKATRARYRAAGSKSDPGDAYILADLLRTDGHRFEPLRPLNDAIRALRAMVRLRDDLVAERVALANQLRALLESFWAGAVAIFADVDTPIALAFLAAYPTPAHAERLGPKRLAAFLARESYCGRRSPEELLGRLRTPPLGTCGELETEVKGALVRSLVAVLEPLCLQIQKLSSAIERTIATDNDAAWLRAFPRIGLINAAQVYAEITDDSRRFASADQLAAEAGVAPVTHASGKHRAVVFRWACNKRLRRAITCWADNSRHSSDWAASVYRAARGRGRDHPHAVRILARAWLRILWQCWRNKTPYDRSRHTAAVRLEAA